MGTETCLTDWITLFGAFAEALDWALDRAADMASAYPEEVAIVERVRAFVTKQIAGERAHLRIEDLLFALGLVAGALERELALSKPRSSLAGYLGARKPMKREPVHVDVRKLRAIE